ncbi:MAG: undecaprenyl-diphosphate phosphatase [Aquificae bacterium]|nr:undecaprenyl-diphosphate phosphatase [Aquificota bacterium]
MELWQAVVLGVVEGLTEFLPVSSTGHLILVSTLLGLKQTEFHKTFEIAIQLGSILAVVYLFRERLLRDPELWKRIIVAFIPTGVLGFLLYKFVKGYLFNPFVVAFMLVLGGVVFILVERWWLPRRKPTVTDPAKVPYSKALAVGLFQSLAMIPGTSRSGATIIGGLLLGLDRRAAAEFSFLLAVPTMFVATGYDLYKTHEHLSAQNWQLLAVGFLTAFFSAVVAVKWFLNFVKTHDFVPFGIYRIVVGLLFLALAAAGLIEF